MIRSCWKQWTEYKFRRCSQQLIATYKLWECCRPCYATVDIAAGRWDVQNNLGWIKRHVVRQGSTNPTWDVSVWTKVLPEEVMAQRTEICDLLLHGVALVNNIKHNFNPMNMVSPAMICRKGFILGWEIYTVQQVFHQTFQSVTYVRTLPIVLLERYGMKNIVSLSVCMLRIGA